MPGNEEGRNSKLAIGQKWKVLFLVTAVIVQAALLLKLPLYLFRQFFPRAIPHFCSEYNKTQHTWDQQYIFTTVIYSFLFLGRFFEALIIEIQIYKFFFREKKKDIVAEFIKNISCSLCSKACWIIVLVLVIILSMHSLAVTSMGISLEVRHGQGTGCRSYPYQTYMVYWILDVIRYAYDVFVRFLLIVATIGIRNIWKKTSEPEDSSKQENCNDPPQKTRIEVYADLLEDRNIVSIDHKVRTEDYVLKGRIAEAVSEIFETWFILPWVIFFIGTSLKTDHILRAWNDGEHSEAKYDYSEITYLVYNVNQLSFLVIPYLCSLLINRGHKKYLDNSRKDQLNRFKNSASTYAYASMQKIEKDVHFDFVPRIWGTSIKIAVDEPFFVFFIFIGVFFTICEALV